MEPDDVAQLVDELGVFGQLKLSDAMRLERLGAPDALDRGNADAGGLGHRRAGPVRSLEDQTAVITGGGAGVGAAVAVAFAEAGADVYLIGWRLNKLELVAANRGERVCSA
jgi:hypothetical protein